MLYIVPFLISIAVNGVFFVLAARMKTDVFTDITYSLTFVLVAAFAFAFRSGSVPEQVFALAFVLAWAIRLGSYLFTRIRKTGVDHRFDAMRDNPVSFGSFWALQAVTVWIVMLPYCALMAGGAAAPASPFVARLAFLAGSVIFAAGFLLEAVADRQKSVFKGNPDNAGKFMDRDGKGAVFGKAFSQKGVIQKILETVSRMRDETGIARYAVVHAASSERAAAFAEQLEAMLGKPPEYLMEISPIVGSHAGKGALAVALESPLERSAISS